MPYTKEHKQKTKDKILKSAFELFTSKGYDGVTVNDLMENCGLTRGAFYAHFSGKSELYNESLKFAAYTSRLAELKPKEVTNNIWLGRLLDEYLSVAHINGNRPCPLAFLATDVVNQNTETRTTYENVFKGFTQILISYTKDFSSCLEEDVLSATAMIIGAVAISRTLNDQVTIKHLLTSCRKEAGQKLGGI